MTIDDADIRTELAHTLARTALPGLGEPYRGKVRDVYRRDGQLIIVTTDRVSAFDHVLGTIPFKGQILNRLAALNFERCADLAPNHVLAVPDPSVTIAAEVTPFPVEFVMRAHLSGSLWRDYEAGRAGVYGVPLPPGLTRDAPLDAPILTPSTKAELGTHDAPISKADIVARGLMTADRLEEAEAIARRLFDRGRALADERGLILVDTKYELGLDARGVMTVIDEIHTPDSSRYWIADGARDRWQRGEPQQMLDKENLRQWLIAERGFSGHGAPPALDDAIRVTLARRYLELWERLVGTPFEPALGDPGRRLEQNLRAAGVLPS